MSETKIEWADKVWNPFTGCSPVSPGCDNCYAKPFAERMAKNPNAKIAHKYRNGFNPTFHPETLHEPSKWKKPQRIFVCSMSDLFHEVNCFYDIEKVYFEMENNPLHTFIVLTKRPERMKLFFTELLDKYHLINQDWQLAKNIWLGVTVENQEQAEVRIPILLSISVSIRFISVEPMLELISLRKRIELGTFKNLLSKSSFELISCIDWVVCGGETGKNVRPLHPSWVYSLRNDCVASGVPFFFKSFGEYLEEDYCYKNSFSYGDDKIESHRQNNVTELYFRVGKKQAGRLLDGVEWNQIPEMGKSEVNP